ncbi:carboxypeptidase-like regulatory domain-containing protein [Actinoplanes sp. NPDC051494]|uniref:carboxypeptidase-like regulatory domain-containing protein n=1 Tax=Actinoplanes sp. NPDC051494 TaxID=3363907 RepID=UPI0037AFB4A7
MQHKRFLRRGILAAVLAGTAAVTTTAGPALAGDPAGSLSGLVRDTRGSAVADATVSVHLDPSGGPVQEVRSDAHGRFRVSGLKPGGYRIQIDMRGWREWAPGRITDAEQATIYRVTAKRTTVATSVVTAPGFITGTFLRADGTPAANTEVAATNVDSAAEHPGRTAADGTYRIRVQPDRKFIISYAVGRFAEYVPHTFTSSGATEFFVRSGQSIRVDDRAIALAGISGRLTDATGAPVAGAGVRVSEIDTARESETTTLADGSYDLSDQLVPGRYKVQFTVSDRSQYAHQAPDYDSATVITVTSGSTTVVDDQLLWNPAER